MKTPEEYYFIGKEEMNKTAEKEGGKPCYGTIEPCILGLIQAMKDYLKESKE